MVRVHSCRQQSSLQLPISRRGFSQGCGEAGRMLTRAGGGRLQAEPLQTTLRVRLLDWVGTDLLSLPPPTWQTCFSCHLPDPQNTCLHPSFSESRSQGCTAKCQTQSHVSVPSSKGSWEMSTHRHTPAHTGRHTQSM